MPILSLAPACSRRVGADGFYAVGALDEEMAGAAGERVEDGLGLAGTTRSAVTRGSGEGEVR